MTIRCKMTVTSIKAMNGTTAKEFTFNAMYDETVPEDRRFCKYTPNGSMTLYVDNPAVFDRFELGKSFYLDFKPID